MKKIFLYGIVTMMCATIGGVKAYDGLTHNNMSALMVENIEALTDGDTGDNGTTCTTTTRCLNISGIEMGSVSCTGMECSRTDRSVTCDGKTTKC